MSRPALMEAAPPARGHSPSLASLASSPLSSPLHPCCFLENGAPIWSLCCRPTFTEEDCRCRWSNFWFCGWSIASFLHEFGVLLSPCVLHISAFPSRHSWYEIRFLKNNGMLICCGQRWCIKVQGELMLAPCCRYTSLLTSPKISFSWSRQLYMMKPLILEFVQVLSRSHLKMRVWERGAGATLACGTGACAVVVAVVLEGRAERI